MTGHPLDVGEEPQHPMAVALHQVLEQALRDRGPAPCQSSLSPLAWDYDGLPSRLLAVEAAVACGGCPVRGECLVFAIASDQRHGIWGGLTPAERRGLTVEDVVA